MTQDTGKQTGLKGYKKLHAWQKADALAFEVYCFSAKFPSDELYGLRSQLRRSAASVPINIAEGIGRQNKNETKQFINIALGSLAETEYVLSLCSRLGYIPPSTYAQLETLRETVGKLLWGLYRSLC